jgi:quinol monooxygenase YgiN
MGEDSFVFIWKWGDLASLEAHRTAPHMMAYVAKTRPVIAKRKVRVISAVETGSLGAS